MKIKGFLTTFQISQFYAGMPVWISEKKDDPMHLEVEIDLSSCKTIRYHSNGMGRECLFVGLLDNFKPVVK